ncbi:hypothetical protein HKD37_15G043803 [Glycine soja]
MVLIKCNNDDTIFKEYHYFGDGICLSDEHGHFIKAKTLWQLGIPNPQEVDDWDLLQALKWIPNMDVHYIVIELDYKTVIDAKCRAYLLSFQNSVVSYIRKQTNHVVHILVSASRSYANNHVFDYIPNYVYPIILKEMK